MKEVMALNKAGIAEGFSDAALSYNRWGEAQRQIAGDLAALIPPDLEEGTMADLGCGTGFLTAALRQRYPRACLTGYDLASGMIALCRKTFAHDPRISFVEEDIEKARLPEELGLAASSSTFQWLGNPAALLARLRTALHARGLLALALFTEGSLEELDASAASAFQRPMPSLRYYSPEHWCHRVESSGFTLLRNETRPVRLWFEQPMDILRTFKGIGATFRHQEGYLARSPGEIRRLLSIYRERYSASDGRLPLTYQVQYLLARPSALPGVLPVS